MKPVQTDLLKSCLFCDSKPFIQGNAELNIWFIYCINSACGAVTSFKDLESNMKKEVIWPDVIDRYNRRIQDGQN